MYEIINCNIGRILDNTDKYLDIRIYLTLLNRFRDVDVTRDTEFQNQYCRYWRLFGAGLGLDFRSAYFELMEHFYPTGAISGHNTCLTKVLK